MNNKQQKYLDMMIVVENYFIVDLPISILSPAFTQATASLTNIIGSIKQLIQLQGQAITGIEVDIIMQKNALTLLAATVAGILYGWSSSIVNKTINNQVKCFLTDLEQPEDTEFVSVCLNILALANDNLKELQNFGLLESQLQNLTSVIEEFKSSAALSDRTILQGLVYQKKLVILFKQADDILKNFIDKMMLTFRFSNPNTYAKYISNRSIIIKGIPLTQLKGKVISVDNLKGLKNVLITLLSKNEQQVTSSFGRFSFKGVSIGKYSIALSMVGYQDLVLNDLIVKQGKLSTRKITMQKI